MCASSVCGGLASVVATVAVVDVVNFNDATLVILSTVLFLTRSPVASAVFTVLFLKLS